MTWQILGRLGASGLRDARLQAHRAAQGVAAAGETFLEPTPDASHVAMSWDVKQGALFGRVLSATRPCRVALRVADLTLLVLGADDAPFAELALPGRTLDEADRFVADQVQAYTRAERVRSFVHPEYELEPHALARDGRFEADAGLPELARWYANAQCVLRRLERETPSAGAVLCWPQHFDLATLITVEMDRSGEPVRTVGVGFSPGDGCVAQPYWYVNHAPASQRSDLPSLEAGEWFSEGWVGALLRGDALVAAGGASEQQARVATFLASAIPASRALALESPIGGT